MSDRMLGIAIVFIIAGAIGVASLIVTLASYAFVTALFALWRAFA